MLLVVIGTSAVCLWAVFVYLWRERLGVSGLALATLRTTGFAFLLVLIVNPGTASRVSGGPPVVLLDESLSMSVGGGWAAAVDTAQAIASTGGTILRFGSSVKAFDTLPPVAGASRLRGALYTAQALGRPTYVVTDGEIEDLGAIPPRLLDHAVFVIVPRDTLTDVALMDVTVPTRARSNDSVHVDVSVGAWGRPRASTALLDVTLEGRTLASQEIDLPADNSVVRRRISVAPGYVPAGDHVLNVRISADGDEVPFDDVRQRMLLIAEQPAVVVLADYPDWEGSFLASAIRELAGPNVMSFARVRDEEWLDMATSRRVTGDIVQRAAGGSDLLVVRGNGGSIRVGRGANRALWLWPGGMGVDASFRAGDWYASSSLPASPLAAQIGLVDWDSLPPLVGLAQVLRYDQGWVALTARLGRRGTELPALVGRDSAGRRELTTLASGLWRWRFRGGAAMEAYRSLLAAGMDWLLGAESTQDVRLLAVAGVVPRGEMLGYRWTGEAVPDSLVVDFESAANARKSTAVLRFDEQGYATHELPPGTYRWSVRGESGMSGVSIVEEYSTEYVPRRVGAESGGAAAATMLVERRARDRWWLFVLAVAVLAAEWGWRHKRGLP